MCGFFLQLWLYRSLSSSLQLVFSKDFSTCRCVFDVFMVGGEFHIFLLCHLDPKLRGLDFYIKEFRHHCIGIWKMFKIFEERIDITGVVI